MVFQAAGSIIPVWNLHRVDPGYIYVIESHSRYKIGKTKQIEDRVRAAKTWLPDMTLVGMKPFWGVSHHERRLHIGLAMYWYSGEWFDFKDDHDLRDLIMEGFVAFSDNEPDKNSVDFIYWYNGINMLEFGMEMSREQLTLPKFQKQTSISQKRR